MLNSIRYREEYGAFVQMNKGYGNTFNVMNSRINLIHPSLCQSEGLVDNISYCEKFLLFILPFLVGFSVSTSYPIWHFWLALVISLYTPFAISGWL